MVVSCQKGNGRGSKVKPILRKENGFFYCFNCALKGHSCFYVEVGNGFTSVPSTWISNTSVRGKPFPTKADR